MDPAEPSIPPEIEVDSVPTPLPSHPPAATEGGILLSGPSSPRSMNDRLTDSLKNGILLLAVMFATITFAAVLNPPGGLWQDWSAGDPNGTATHIPGKAINHELARREFAWFLFFDAACFMGSVLTILVLMASITFNRSVSGFAECMTITILMSALAVFCQSMSMMTSTRLARKIIWSSAGTLTGIVAVSIPTARSAALSLMIKLWVKLGKIIGRCFQKPQIGTN